LLDAGATVTAYDPEGMEVAAAMMPGVVMKDSAYAAAQGADAVAIVTEWDAFRALDLARLGASMTDKLLVDLRNIYRREEVARHGFRHIAIGTSDD
jgi:UDPglucose 6-dehydrogenase